MKPFLFALFCMLITPIAGADPLSPLVRDYETYAADADGSEEGAAVTRWGNVRKTHIDERTEVARSLIQQISVTRTRRTTDKAILLRLLQVDLVAGDMDLARVPFNGDWGFQAEPIFIALQIELNSAETADAWTQRLHDVPRYFSEHITNMRRGVETGWVAHEDPLNTAIAQIREQIIPVPEESDLYKPYLTLPDDMDAAQVARLQEEGRAAVLRAILAYEDTLRFLETEYRLAVRDAPGLGGLPGGREAYVALLDEHTAGAGFAPEEIHQLGKREIVRIRAEMDEILTELTFEGDISDFISFLKSEPAFYATSEQALLIEANELSKRLRQILPEYFYRLPKLDFEVLPVPAAIAPGYTSARYVQGDVKRSLKGQFLVNTYALDQRPLYELPSLAAHEAVPGHHLQIALAQEMTGVSKFRRNYYATAFGEGWGLYAETIAGEAGIYDTPYAQFGALSMEMWRACRLVADTGLHWYGWSRDEAEACFRENTALSDLNIRNEVTRYIGWPGQATAYKVGELKILALRARAEAQLGGAFDIRDFHDAVLAEGAVPLDVLEQNIAAWTLRELDVDTQAAP